MTTYFKSSCSALALLLTLGFADAQTTDRKEPGAEGGKPGEAGKPKAGPEAQKSEGPRKAAGEPQKEGSQGKPPQGSGQTAEKPAPEGKDRTVQKGSEPGAKGTPPQESPKGSGQAAGKPAADSKDRTVQKEGDTGNKAAPGQDAPRKSDDRGAHAKIAVTPEQNTKVRDVFVHETEIRRYSRSDITFAIDVGTRIPDTIVFYDAPPALIEVVPDFRRYKIIVLDDEILIVDPETREIVDVVPI